MKTLGFLEQSWAYRGENDEWWWMYILWKKCYIAKVSMAHFVQWLEMMIFSYVELALKDMD